MSKAQGRGRQAPAFFPPIFTDQGMTLTPLFEFISFHFFNLNIHLFGLLDDLA